MRTAVGLKGYFLNRLSKAARASFCPRGDWLGPGDGGVASGEPSRATVTRGSNSAHSLAWSFIAILAGTGFKHWKSLDGSKWAHCLQQCKAAPHFGQLPRKSMSGGKAVEQL